MSSVLPLPGDSTSTGLASSIPDSTPALQSDAGYRPDIDGLRGIAVLSVLAVHSFPQWIKGGFIGVDIFFVLSGFLITGILFQSLEAGRFSYADFYTRRVRRIFPALCLVLFACLVFSALYTFPSESRQIGAHVGAGALFVSNIALWKEAGYFDVASEAKPLLHLWSLGIEEQFYLVWPVVVVFLFRHRRWALWFICAALLISFLLNIAFVAEKPTATFFLPPTRFWELMVGALLAYLTRYHGGAPVAWLGAILPAGSRLRRYLGDALAASGLTMLIVAMWLVDKTAHFPGWWALLPTLGTFALLAAGPAAWVNRRVLSQPILRFYGAISYPLYLWHWPLLSFPVVMGIPLTNEVRVMILIGSVVLAALTYDLLEKPIRFGRTGRRTPLAFCGALALIGAAGFALKQSDGLIDAYPLDVRTIARAEFGFDLGAYRSHRCFLDLESGPASFADECSAPHAAVGKVTLLWGDSHAASLYPGLAAEMPAGQQAAHLAQFTKARCPPLVDLPARTSHRCRETNDHVLQRIAADPPDTVVLGGYWSFYGDAFALDAQQQRSLRQTVERLRADGVRRVIVVGHLPTWTIPLPRLLLREWEHAREVPQRSLASLDRRAMAMDRSVRDALAGTTAIFISPIDRMCDATGCLVSKIRAGVAYPLAHDQSHLTVEGSTILIQRSREALFN